MDSKFNAAQDVAEYLDDQLAHFDWLTGIGLTTNPFGPYAVFVYVVPGKLLDQAIREGNIPASVNGVNIYLKHKEVPNAL